MIKGVISMPSNIFANTGTNVSVLFLDHANEEESAILIDASNFGEKVKELRTRKGLSQEDLASKTGVTVRTVRNWETGGKYPRSRDLYAKLADALGVSEEYLRGEQELFLTRAAEEYGTRGQRQAQAFLDSTRAMFAGGDLSPEDIDMIGKHFMEMFWEAKENARKYTPKRYRDDTAAGDNS